MKRKRKNKRWGLPRNKNKQEEYRRSGRSYHFLHRYGLSLEDVEAIVHKQMSACAICEVVTPSLRIDHNHTTGKVRAALCQKCNTGLGMFDEDVERMAKAIQYLKFHREVKP